MSLVNDMLRELEERRATPQERAALAGLLPVEELRPPRPLWHWLLAGLGLLALGGALVWRLQAGGPAAPTAPAVPTVPVPASAAPAAQPVATPVPPAPSAPVPVSLQLLALLPEQDERQLQLQLLFDRQPVYRRQDAEGLVSLLLPDLQLAAGQSREGQLQHQGRSLLWSLRPAAQGGSELLLAGLGRQLQVRERLQAAAGRWQLWVEVALPAAAVPTAAPVVSAAAQQPLPAAERLPEAPASALPVTAPRGSAPAALAAAPAAQPAAVPSAAARAQAAARSAAGAAAPGEVKIAPARTDALAEARAALQAGRSGEAVRLLESLQRQQPDDVELRRWLARSWLAAGQLRRLPEQVPGWLQQRDDGELRMLLGRARLQLGDAEGAVAVLSERLPPVSSAASSHVLLAAALQQLGRWEESVRLYRGLLATQPDTASWRLGLAIGLERLGREAEAVEHYRMALQGQGLDDASRRFVRERIQALGGVN